jgi:RNA polymerase sigma-70 factor (ECF subfamily)
MTTNPTASAAPPAGPEGIARLLASHAERRRLLRHCLYLTGGDADAAEDLAQETLFEAWRLRGHLADMPHWRPFVYGIAHNVSLRWRRRTGREAARRAPGIPPTWEAETAARPDFDAGLEGAEVAGLLDRAMARLTPTTRALLVAHYVDGVPQAEAASRFGIAENAAAVRLHRAKETLRGELTAGDLRHEAVALGVVAPEAARERWVETRIWCPMCGARQMQGRHGDAETGTAFTLVCPGCRYTVGPRPLGGHFSACFFTHEAFRPETVLGGVTAFKPALNRLHGWWYGSLRTGVEKGRMRCLGCGREIPLLTSAPRSPRYAYPTANWLGVHAPCLHCGHVHVLPPSGFAVSAPPVQRFWKAHPRMRMLPVRRLPGHPRGAFVAGFESLTGAARVEVLLAGDTFEVLEP